MNVWLENVVKVTPRLLKFSRRVLGDFFLRNNGLLLSGAIAYNALLSMIPLCAVLLVIFSHLLDQQRLMATLSVELAMIVPGHSAAMIDATETFLASREVIGSFGFLFLVLFSTIGFRVLENAFAVIFGRRLVRHEKRSFWVSALLPYFFITLLGVGLLFITAVTWAVDRLPGDVYEILGIVIYIDRALAITLYLFGVIGLILLFTALYVVMPVTRISFRRALAGGVTAAILWEIVRHILVVYFATVSVVNVIYGSMATVIIVLLSLEIGAIIVLLGAQVIAELEMNSRAGAHWFEDLDQVQPAPPPADIMRRESTNSPTQ